MENLILKQEFKKIILAIETQMNLDVAFSTAIEPFFEGHAPMYNNSNLLVGIIEFLKGIFKDESDCVGYFIYELDFGKKYKKGVVIDPKGKNIRLKTASDLYNLLIDNLNCKTS